MTDPPRRLRDRRTRDDRDVDNELLFPTRQVLDAVVRRRALLQFLRGTACGVLILIVGVGLLMLIDQVVRPVAAWRAGLSGLVLIFAVLVAWRSGWSASLHRDRLTAARGLRDAFPGWGDSLLAAVEFAEEKTRPGSLRLRQHLQQNVAKRISGLSVAEVLPWRLVRRPVGLAVAAIVVACGLLGVDALQMPTRIGRVMLPLAPIEPASRTRIAIRRPVSSTSVVPAGEWVAVVAEVTRREGEDVWLQWQESGGERRREPMHPRTASGEPSTTEGQPPIIAAPMFAASMWIEDRTVRYRVVAGDGQTNWRTLVPQRRPQVQEYIKRIRFPRYTEMPELVRRSSSGDIHTLAGAEAEVEVRFDQAVRDAVVVLSDDDQPIEMARHTDEPQKWSFRLPVNRDYRYRVEATGKSGMTTAATGDWAIVRAAADQPPRAIWQVEPKSVMLVANEESLELSAEVSDDLPLDTVLQQTKLPGDRMLQRALPDSAIRSIDASGPPDFDPHAAQRHHSSEAADGRNERKLKQAGLQPVRQAVQWDWKLSSLAGEDATELMPGARVKTRLVAIDRAGQRGVSSWREYLIVEQAADPRRLEEADEQLQLIRAVTSWIHDLRKKLESTDFRLTDSSGISSKQFLSPLPERWSETSGIDVGLPYVLPTDLPRPDETSPVVTLANRLGSMDDLAAMERWAAIDRTVAGALQSLSAAEPSEVSSVAAEVDSNISAASAVAESIGTMNRVIAVSTELAWLSEAMRRLADPDNGIPVVGLPARAEVVAEQWKRLGRWLDRVGDQEGDEPERAEPDVPLKTLVERTVAGIGEAVRDLRQAPGAMPEVAFRQSIRQLADEVDSRRTVWTVDPVVVHSLLSSMRELSQPSLLLSEPLSRAASRLARRADADVRSLADLHLIEEVMSTLHAKQPLTTEVRTAVDTLRLGVELRHLRRQLYQVEQIERYASDPIDRRVAQGLRLEQYAVVLKQVLDHWEEIGQSEQVSQPLRQTITGREYAVARDLLVSRRDRADAAASAAEPLESLRSTWRAAQPELEAVLSRARRLLKSERPATSQLARDAAETAEKGAAQIRMKQTSGDDLAELEDRARRLRQATGRLARRLVDEANNLNYADRDEAAFARQLDEAVRSMAEQTSRATENLRRAKDSAEVNAGEPSADTETLWSQTEQSWTRLQSTLTRLAEELDRRESGEQRGAESSDGQSADSSVNSAPADPLGDPDATNALRQSARSAAEAAEESPADLLKRLEEVLRRDRPMRSELRRIADLTESAAESSIRDAAERQRQLSRYLEQSDDVREQVRQDLSQRLVDVADLAETLDSTWIDAAVSAVSNKAVPREAVSEEAASARETNEPRPELQQIRQQLIDAVRQIREANPATATLEDWRRLAEKLEQKLRAFAKQVQPETLGDATDQPESARQVRAAARQTRNEWLKGLKRDMQRLTNLGERATARRRELDEQQRQFENIAETAEMRARNQPQSQTLRLIADRARERAEGGKRAIEAAVGQEEKIDQLQQLARRRWQDATTGSRDPLPADATAIAWQQLSARQSANWATSLADELETWIGAPDDSAGPKVDPTTADRFVDQQQQVRAAVAKLVDDLRRVSRHRQRLSETESEVEPNRPRRTSPETADESLNRVASSLEATWAEAMAEAADAIANESAGNQVADSPGKRAVEALSRAAEQLESAAGQMGSAMTRKVPTGTAEPDGQRPTGAATGASDAAGDRSRQLARMLDELDRFTARQLGQPSGGDDASATSPAGAVGGNGSERSGDATGGSESGREGRQSSNINAGEASPTLDAAARAAIRRLAELREQQAESLWSDGSAEASSSAGGPTRPDQSTAAAESGTSADSSDNSQSAGTGGSSSAASGSATDLPRGDPRFDGPSGGRWSALRQQAVEQLGSDQRETIPPSYRPAVDAYFQRMATEAAAVQSGRERP